MTTEQKYDCVFCKETFDDKEALQIHFRKHGDPKFNKISKSKGRTLNEESSTEKPVEENEMVGCDVCEEVFPTISKAITHKHKVHPDHDAKYFCSFCGKVFTMKHLFNKHIQTNHNGEPTNNTRDFYCECCEVAFYVAPAMLYHNKFFHRQDSELPAIGQSKKVKLYNQKHMGDDHADEQQSPNEVLRCPLCEAIFYHLDAFEVHLTFHTTEDLYSEKNEIAEGVTEFSLETVPPIMEKVEDDQQPEDNMNEEGIDSFLQLVMGESEEPEKVKVKKHKKHKKSKKSAITLDEFLNMNKDVFGDGLDVQGIEEVPTPFVLKKPKVKKVMNKVVNADLAKLKKIGITVKTKTANPVVANIKNVPTKISTPITSNRNKVNSTSSPNEIISKLMNQGNSQIKIVKKTVPQNVAQNIIESNEQESTIKSPDVGVDKDINEGVDLNRSVENEAKDENNSVVDDNTDIESSNVKDVSEEGESTHCKEDDLDSVTIPKSNSSVKEDNHTEPITSAQNNSDEITEDDGNICEESDNFQQNQNKDHISNDSTNSCINSKENQDDTEKEVDNVALKTLNALKHLSHLLTVKPVTNNKNVQKTSESNNMNKETVEVAKETKLDKPLRNLSEQITIKTPKSPSVNTNNASDGESENGHPNSDIDDDEDLSQNNDGTNKNNTPKQVHSPHTERTSTPTSTKTNIPVSNKPPDVNIKSELCPKKIANLNILKRLTNVTAKPISKANTQLPNKMNKNISSTNIKQEKGKIYEEIEVFNIDDSDSDDNEQTETVSEEAKKNNVPLDALKSLSKNITVKSSQMTNSKVTTYRAESNFENYTKFNKQTPEIQKSINLQNKLNNFGSHITVKSRNSSPINKDRNISDADDENDEQDFDSGTDEEGAVRITEVQEDAGTDGEGNENDTNAMVESPKGTHSDQGEIDEDLADKTYETSKSSPLNRQNDVPSKKASGIESLNLNKELTIKSLTKNCDNDDGSNHSRHKDVNEETKNTSKELVLKQFKQNATNDQPTNKTSQPTGGSMSQSFNQKVSTSSNQVTKTVKRFQSQTIIEEITTTVTKTIRTVNQSTNEEVQSTSQFTPKPTVRPQKIINRLPQPGREFQGTTIRQITPTVGTKIRSTGTAVRSPKPMVRPSNQVVPMRPSNLIRPSLPSPSAIRRPIPQKSIPQRPAIGKLKISPHAISQTVKRPSEEVAHFSCFKKPKDSGIFHNDGPDSDDESTTQYSASQSQTKYASVTKTVKGKTGVTSMKSETSTSSQQHLSKLSNVSGLKIVKTNSSNKVEERSEVTSTNKNTLEALEKLQKQGLLIKKPRLEEYSEQTNSYSESDGDESEK
ncbi:unnamed protein product [Danaus chrysippus]|uniref:(African queen) hypothetical protein n=1 Tax=Danaus chrysippus TaxID=151541 RepID=A0A8J2VQM7_9NEOP|nr:unnamed protein product [Danaus chrysippus]